jgi:Rps23 Pro-64 3,4-dihydroxylase Tpa1-like proline 4-hydroxylase
MSAGADAAQHSPGTPYCVYRDFLDFATHAGLLAWAIDNEAKFKASKVNNNGTERVDPSARVSMRVRDFGPIEPTLRQRMLALTPVFIRDLRVTSFQPHDIETELVASNDGAFFVSHIDTFTGGVERLVSAVYYFHAEPKMFSGGALRLHTPFKRAGEIDFIDVEPEQNTLVVFPSWMPHEVTPVSCPSRRFSDSRFSVNLWILRKLGS